MRAILRQAVSGGTPPLLREGDALDCIPFCEVDA